MSIAPANHPLSYLCNVDDIFAVFETNESCLKFLNILNSQHNNMKFNVEYGSELTCFLDIQIKVKENGCDTWMWRKTTHTGLLLNFDALCPLTWKSGLILCLLNRAKAICSSKLLFQKDVIKLRQIFLSNDYPIWCFNKFLPRFLTVDNDLSDRERSEINPVVYFNVPCIGKESRHFVSCLAKLFHVIFDVKVFAIYKTFKIGTHFQLKSHITLLLCLNVVYKFTCLCDSNLTYIGKSTRHLSTRVGEHLNVASHHENSGIKQLILSCTVCSNVRHDLNFFEILKQCKSDFQAKIHEALGSFHA